MISKAAGSWDCEEIQYTSLKLLLLCATYTWHHLACFYYLVMVVDAAGVPPVHAKTGAYACGSVTSSCCNRAQISPGLLLCECPRLN